MELMQANQQWTTRPADERYTSLHDMHSHFVEQRQLSREMCVSSRRLECVPDANNKGLMLAGPSGHAYAPTNWAFGQLANLAGAPAGYLRNLPSPIAADCINYGLKYSRDVEDIGVLLYKNGSPILRAATGPRYGRIWNHEITDALTRQFGDGVTGDFKVPGEFGQAVEVTKANTTLFAGDRDMFVFLADEKNRIEVPNRRNGESGLMARGFFVWNSEVGSATFGLASFLFDYVCCNRIVWGAAEFKQVTIRHTSSAPDRWLEEVAPAIQAYANSSTGSVVHAIEDAKAKRLDDVDGFLAQRFGKRMVDGIKAAHFADEHRPIETVWDVVTGVTAKARSIEHQDTRVALERLAGQLMD